MKKIVLYFIATTMIALSCSKDKPGNTSEKTEGPDIETPSPDEAQTFPTKIVLTAGSETTTYQISYLPGGDKIEKITKEDAGKETFEYDGDLIKQISHDDSGENYNKFEYSDGQLTFLQLGEVAEIEAEVFSFAQKFNRRTAVEFST